VWVEIIKSRGEGGSGENCVKRERGGGEREGLGSAPIWEGLCCTCVVALSCSGDGNNVRLFCFGV
jgi:hypothetical protein